MLNFSNVTVEQLYREGVRQHMAGRAEEAERWYRQALAMDGRHADSWHMLGVLAYQAGRSEEAMGLLGKAVELAPGQAAYRSNLGEACRLAGKLERAEAEFRRAMAIMPELGDAHTNLAVLLLGQERHREALGVLEELMKRMPGNANGWRLMGDVLVKLKRIGEALGAYERAVGLKPDFWDARFNVALLQMDAGRLREAEAGLRAVIAATPEDWGAWEQLAEALKRMWRKDEAFGVLMELVRRNPGYAQGHGRLGNYLRDGDRVDEALKAYERALELDPKDWLMRANLALALRDYALLKESMEQLRGVLAEHPEAAGVHSGLIFTMYLAPGMAREEIKREQRLWNRRHGDPVAGQRGGYGNDRAGGRRLKIGYMSADLRAHPVGRFMLPLVRNHDRSAVEVYCYQTSRNEDEMTREIEGAADHFKRLGGKTDEEVAEEIRGDGIDILVDLNNHTVDNRMVVLARRPAPVQISYLAFNAGTGVETVDWRLTDPLIDPEGSPDEGQGFEKPLRLAETYWCYAEPKAAGEVTGLPALAGGVGGGVTFGSFNYFSKCNDRVLELWARVLREVSGSRLMLHVPVGSRQEYVRQFLAARGVAGERLTLVGRVKEAEYFARYGKVDVALDPFPWCGGTTTCDALWMGVPVVTWGGGLGETLQRGGVSILTNIGHAEWIAWTAEEYVAKARELVGDLGRLAEIRKGLRERMRGSVLMDARRFARHVEAAYRKAWRAWAEGG